VLDPLWHRPPSPATDGYRQFHRPLARSLMTGDVMVKTTTTKKQQRHAEQCNAMIAFAETIERPFDDLRPYPGESETMRNFLSNNSLLRRLSMARAAGLVPPRGTPERRAYDALWEDVVEKDTCLRAAASNERVSRRIREGTI
jgi:hypothetical protein